MSITRFAPSPTGLLHLGHAYSAMIGHWRAGAGAEGRFLVRIEDLDRGRSRAEFIDAIFADLEWLGLDWGEPVLVQSQRTAAYAEALSRLRAEGLVYPCFCTRADIATALSAPHETSPSYPGTCSGLADDPERRGSEPHSWRLHSARALARTGPLDWTGNGMVMRVEAEAIDDVVLARKDAPAAYHLACVVDDFESGISEVVRGADLAPSTPVQRLLQALLDYPAPLYFHHALVGLADGRRLAKRDRAPALAAMRAAGVNGRELAERLVANELPLGFAFLDA